MKRIFLLSISVMFTGLLMAGGIITNQNQSAMYTRLQARDATLGIDAVFYNPAGLTLLPNNGFYLSINNQTLGQTRIINSDYSTNPGINGLNQDEYIGKISAPFFPGFYAAYKLDKFAFSLGFNPIGGGGGGTYEDGLPSFEYNISDLVPATGADAYSVDAYFEGSSVFFGYQANVSYKINDMIQVAIGGRFVSAREAYQGYLRDITLDFGGTTIPATTFFGTLATTANGAATNLGLIEDAGYGSLTFAEAETFGIITATERAQLEGGLTQMGYDPSTLDISTSQSIYSGAASQYGATSQILQDQEADYEKTATGFTPIISVNIKASDKLNLALKYEHHTKLEFTNKTTKDLTTGFDPGTGEPITMFPNGAKTRLDIPSLVVVGATYKPMEKLLISTGFHYYFDKNAEYGKTGEDASGEEVILKNADILDNSWEFALGVQYSISEKFLVSLGWLNTSNPVSDEYQTDLSPALSSNTIGGGFQYQISPMFDVNIGASYTKYVETTKTFTHSFPPPTGTQIIETYNKNNLAISIGLNFNFSAGK